MVIPPLPALLPDATELIALAHLCVERSGYGAPVPHSQLIHKPGKGEIGSLRVMLAGTEDKKVTEPGCR